MNRPDFSELVAALKGGASKDARFQPAKPGNFDGARDRKVVDIWLTKMEDYLHAATWWRTKREKRKGRTMATLGNSSRNASRPNLSQGTPITSRGANFATL